LIVVIKINIVLTTFQGVLCFAIMFLADSTNGRAYASVASVCLSVCL